MRGPRQEFYLENSHLSLYLVVRAYDTIVVMSLQPVSKLFVVKSKKVLAKSKKVHGLATPTQYKLPKV